MNALIGSISILLEEFEEGRTLMRPYQPLGEGHTIWLFLGSQQAGPRAAVLFTILAGARRHRIEPWTYLRELLLRLHDDDPRLDEMLPDQWAMHHPEAMLTYRLEESRRKAAARSSRRRHARAVNQPS
jgi:transposase